MDQFWIKLISLFAAAAAVLGYNAVLNSREQAEKIDSLKYELKAQAVSNAVGAGSDSRQGSGDPQSAADETSPYNDGSYEGEAQGFGGSIKVRLTVANGSISDIEILSADGEDSAYLDSARAVIDDIISAQSCDVDAVSGATFSSTGIRNAAREALGKAEKQ